jgi:[ribosomal protein S5]-alanine N-acetyltransferase
MLCAMLVHREFTCPPGPLASPVAVGALCEDGVRSSLPVAVPAGAVSGRPQPVIDADAGLSLRLFAEADIDMLVRACADPAIQRWHRQAETGAEWAVAASGVVVGRVGLPVLHLDEGIAEVGYWVLPEGRGRGVAGRALTAMTDWLFDLGLHRVELMHSVLNEPS